jgi:hypothetical protein
MTSTTIDMTAFNTAVKSARNAAKNVNTAGWVIGDAATSVKAAYGQNKVQAFADAIGLAYKSVLDFRAVAEAYAPADRSPDNSHSIHQVFMRQDDRAALVKSQKWTVKAARELVNSRKAPALPKVVTRDDLLANIARLRTELEAAEAALVEYDAAHAPAPVTPADAPVHTVPGVPSHKATEPRTDCNICQAAGVTPMPAPRKSRNRRQPAGSAAK